METITNDPGNEQPIATPIVHLHDSATGDHILSTQWLQFPKKPKGNLQLDMYIEDQNPDLSQRLHLLCIIDSLDRPNHTIYVTLNKVYLNDVQQYPPPSTEPVPEVPPPTPPQNIETPPPTVEAPPPLAPTDSA